MAVLLISSAGFSQTFSKNARDHFNKGNEKVSEKDYTGAAGEFTVAIKLDSTFKQAYENRGVARFYLLDYKGAIDDYTKALRIDPIDYDTYGRRGWARFYLHDYTGAVSDLDKAVQGGKDKYRYFNFRGEAKFRLKDFDGAIADFNAVIGSLTGGKGQKSKAYYWRGMIEISRGRKEAGCLDLKKAERSGFEKAAEAIELYCDKSVFN